MPYRGGQPTGVPGQADRRVVPDPGRRHRPHLAATTALQTASWTLPAALITAATIAVFVATGPADDALVTILLGARIGLLAGAGVFVASAVALTLTRERHLFRYFKDR